MKTIPEKKNMLTFIKLTLKNSDSRQLAEFKCDCGKTHETQLRYYLSGKTKSCGCQKYSGIKAHQKIMTSDYSNKRTFSKAYTQLLSNAKKRNIAFRIPKEVCETLLSKECFYCKKQYEQPISLDRVDNSKPYTKDNVVPCCKVCNRMKLNLTFSEFISHVEKIAVAHVKWSEFREGPGEDNSEPSLSSNTLEGAKTSNRVLSKDSNVATSALA